MMYWVVKLTRHGDQYRVTLPRKLIEGMAFQDVEFVRLEEYPSIGIIIKEYYGKGKEKGDLQEDQT